MLLALLVVGCSKEERAIEDSGTKVVAEPSSPKVVPSTPPSAPPEPMTAAMVVCKKLDAAGLAPDCRTGTSATTARFGQEGSAFSGVVSVFEDRKTFDTISAMLAKEKGKKLATSVKTLTVVAWESDSADIEKKIRATVAAL